LDEAFTMDDVGDGEVEGDHEEFEESQMAYGCACGTVGAHDEASCMFADGSDGEDDDEDASDASSGRGKGAGQTLAGAAHSLFSEAVIAASGTASGTKSPDRNDDTDSDGTDVNFGGSSDWATDHCVSSPTDGEGDSGGGGKGGGAKRKRRKRVPKTKVAKQKKGRIDSLKLETALYACIDVEVTGASRALHEICEIGLAAFRITHEADKAKEVGIDFDECESWLVKPADEKVKWDEGKAGTGTHGIKPNDKDADGFAVVWTKVCEWLKELMGAHNASKTVLVAHNMSKSSISEPFNINMCHCMFVGRTHGHPRSQTWPFKLVPSL
jgi:hypothetical protein